MSNKVCSFTLNTKKVSLIECRQFNGNKYFRTREIAEVLNFKQPFELVKNIRAQMGVETILKGDRTSDFRDAVKDTERTTFISINDLILFLTYYNPKQKCSITQKMTLLKELKNLRAVSTILKVA